MIQERIGKGKIPLGEQFGALVEVLLPKKTKKGEEKKRLRRRKKENYKDRGGNFLLTLKRERGNE